MSDDPQIKDSKELYKHDYADHPTEGHDLSPGRDIEEPLEMRQIRWLDDALDDLSDRIAGVEHVVYKEWFRSRSMSSWWTDTFTHSLWETPTRVTIHYYSSALTWVFYWVYNVTDNVQRTMWHDSWGNYLSTWYVLRATDGVWDGIKWAITAVSSTTFTMTYTVVWAGAAGTVQVLFEVS